MANSINTWTVGCMIYLIVLNCLLFGLAQDFLTTTPDFIIDLNSSVDNYDNLDDTTDVGTWEYIKTGFGKVNTVLKIFTFGIFINVDTIEQPSVRFWLRLILTLIFQLLPIIIMVMMAMDWIRGK